MLDEGFVILDRSPGRSESGGEIYTESEAGNIHHSTARPTTITLILAEYHERSEDQTND